MSIYTCQLNISNYEKTIIGREPYDWFLKKIPIGNLKYRQTCVTIECKIQKSNSNVVRACVICSCDQRHHWNRSVISTYRRRLATISNRRPQWFTLRPCVVRRSVSRMEHRTHKNLHSVFFPVLVALSKNSYPVQLRR